MDNFLNFMFNLTVFCMVYFLLRFVFLFFQVFVSFVKLRRVNLKRNMLFAKKHKNSENLIPLSVIIPVSGNNYNTIKAIEEIRKIDYPHLEYIIVNDGATDSVKKEIFPPELAG